MTNKIPIYIAKVIDDDLSVYQVDKVSFVAEPAIEEDFIFLNRKNKIELAINEEKRETIGPLMIPEKLIYRKTKDKEWYLKFTKEDIEIIRNKFMRKGFFDNTNIEHNIPSTGNYLIETWIVEDSEKDKSAKYGFSLPVGSLMIKYKIRDEQLWSDIKAGKINGYSLEGYFRLFDEATMKNVELSTYSNINNTKNMFGYKNRKNQKFNAEQRLAKLYKGELSIYQTESGEMIEVIDNLAYFVSESGELGDLVPASTYKVVDESGAPVTLIIKEDGATTVTPVEVEQKEVKKTEDQYDEEKMKELIKKVVKELIDEKNKEKEEMSKQLKAFSERLSKIEKSPAGDPIELGKVTGEIKNKSLLNKIYNI